MNHFLRKATRSLKDSSSTESSLQNEASILKCKLEAKSQALLILGEELQATKRERDELRQLTNQLESRFCSLKNRMQSLPPGMIKLDDQDGGAYLFTQQLCKLKETNRNLIHELDQIKIKLADSESDSRLLREQLHRMRLRSNLSRSLIDARNEEQNEEANEGIEDQLERQETMTNRSSLLLSQLEKSQGKVKMLEKDIESMLDEKEELILSRNDYKSQVEKLKEQLNTIQSVSK